MSKSTMLLLLKINKAKCWTQTSSLSASRRAHSICMCAVKPPCSMLIYVFNGHQGVLNRPLTNEKYLPLPPYSAKKLSRYQLNTIPNIKAQHGTFVYYLKTDGLAWGWSSLSVPLQQAWESRSGQTQTLLLGHSEHVSSQRCGDVVLDKCVFTQDAVATYKETHNGSIGLDYSTQFSV